MSGIRFSGMASGMDTENIIKELMNVEKMRVTKVEKEKTKLEWKKDVWKEMNTKIYDFYKNQTFDLKSSGSFAKKEATVSDSDAISVTATTGAPRGTHSIKVDTMAKGSFLTSNNEVASNYTATTGGTFTISSGAKTDTFTIIAGMTTSQIIEEINKAEVDVKASYDSSFKKMFLSTTNTGGNATIQIQGIDPLSISADEKQLLTELGFNNTFVVENATTSTNLFPVTGDNTTRTISVIVGGEKEEVDITTNAGINVAITAINKLGFGNIVEAGTGADVGKLKFTTSVNLTGEKVDLENLGFTITTNETRGSLGQDAEFTYNGAALKSSDNEVSVNGLDIILKQEGMTSAATINVTQDTDAIYDKVKDFVLKYNELVLDINGKVNADSARKYEPLTSEEKQAMSDDDVKLWEKKIKDSLLRRDDVLTGLASAMRGVVVSSSGLKDETASMEYKFLSDLGIVTGSYTERGILHIQGDEDDSLYGDKTNTLKEAIEKDPEKVAEFLNAMGTKLYETMQSKMKSTTLSSALTFYNDKSMDKQVKAYESKIADLEERMAAVESRYYKQFAAMEKMIQQLNSQSSSLMGMMGGGQ